MVSRFLDEPVPDIKGAPWLDQYRSFVCGNALRELIVSYEYVRGAKLPKLIRQTKEASGGIPGRTIAIAEALVEASIADIKRWLGAARIETVVCPVPSSSSLSATVARIVSARCGVKIPVARLLAARPTDVPVKTLAWPLRERAVGNRLIVSDRVPPVRVLLVDDVVASGSSMRVAARFMRERGAADVGALALCAETRTFLEEHVGRFTASSAEWSRSQQL
jgi:adenine/guanine phosphoribosyltransferase-like PRPP-binding protein